ncbi:hypothetical protein ACTOB_003970 [Actinoplanes oblitus]|uniref:CBU-0592-like domain-containing protein n=1 Tax=Actinoplanes oblitus TaxID=3040509 RepID=A0ABY8WTX1_9ACTN|nr:hypothetical protein [Actinoplanes oblitus]WIN00273.1 hypothetical protein ACTOB_003970 [Actinoplanes oblitus]
MYLADLLGWAGAGALLLGHALVTRDPGQAAGWLFPLLNLAGSAGLAASGVVHAAWPSAVLNLLWLVLGITALRRLRPGGDRHCRADEA